VFDLLDYNSSDHENSRFSGFRGFCFNVIRMKGGEKGIGRR
jgi:hypothetical protein